MQTNDFDITRIQVHCWPEQEITREGPRDSITIAVHNGSGKDLTWLTIGVELGYESVGSGYGGENNVLEPIRYTTTRYIDTYPCKFDALKSGRGDMRLFPWPAIDYRVRGQFVAIQFSITCELASGARFHRAFGGWQDFSPRVATEGAKDQLGWKDKVCFVTTAAFGDSNHPMVQEFRFLRDDILTRYGPGRRVIDWYNRRGPAMARTIENRPVARLLARTGLRPLALGIRGARAVLRRLTG